MGSEKRFAVLIDADNISAKYVKYIFDEISTEGEITYKRIYGDWTSTANASWKPVLLDWSITPIQQYSYTTGKNSTDSAMIIDAMDILYSHNVDGFCLASSDSDFTRLAARLRESGMTVIGMGARMTPTAFKSACNKFKYLDLIAQGSSLAEAKVEPGGPVAPLAEIGRQIAQIVDDASDDDGWCSLGEIGNILIKRLPDFDVRNYKFARLSNLIRSLGYFDMRSVVGKNFNQIYVRVKDGVLPHAVDEITGENKPRPRRTATTVKPAAGAMKVAPAVSTEHPADEPAHVEAVPAEAEPFETAPVASVQPEPVPVEAVPVETVHIDADADIVPEATAPEADAEPETAGAVDEIEQLQVTAPPIPTPQPLPERAEQRVAEQTDTHATEAKVFETAPVIIGPRSISSLRRRTDFTNFIPKPVADPVPVEVTERPYSVAQSPVRAVRYRRFDSDAMPIEPDETPEVTLAKAEEKEASEIIKAAGEAVDAAAAAVGAHRVETGAAVSPDDAKPADTAAEVKHEVEAPVDTTEAESEGKVPTGSVDNKPENAASAEDAGEAAGSESQTAAADVKLEGAAPAETEAAKPEQKKTSSRGRRGRKKAASENGDQQKSASGKAAEKKEQPKAKQSAAKEADAAAPDVNKTEQPEPAKSEKSKAQTTKKQQQKTDDAAAKQTQTKSEEKAQEKKAAAERKTKQKKTQESSDKPKAEMPKEEMKPEPTKAQPAASETAVEKAEQKKTSHSRRGRRKKAEQPAESAEDKGAGQEKK